MQIIETGIVDTSAVTLTSATRTYVQGAVTYGPVAAAISPSGAGTLHTLSTTLAVPLPGGLVPGAVTIMDNWLRNGISRSATYSAAIAPVSAQNITSPTSATITGPYARNGDTWPLVTASLADAVGVVNLSAAIVTVTVAPYWAPTTKATVACTITDAATGTVQFQLPAALDDGIHYAFFVVTWPDGTATSFPNTSPGAAITLAN